MIVTITGALRAIKQAGDIDTLRALKAKLSGIAWNDGGEIRNALECRESELLRQEGEEKAKRAEAYIELIESDFEQLTGLRVGFAAALANSTIDELQAIHEAMRRRLDPDIGRTSSQD